MNQVWIVTWIRSLIAQEYISMSLLLLKKKCSGSCVVELDKKHIQNFKPLLDPCQSRLGSQQHPPSTCSNLEANKSCPVQTPVASCAGLSPDGVGPFLT
jgi:hypothetical protein